MVGTAIPHPVASKPADQRHAGSPKYKLAKSVATASDQQAIGK
nr:hypothetical protein [Marortus luteolus]